MKSAKRALPKLADWARLFDPNERYSGEIAMRNSVCWVASGESPETFVETFQQHLITPLESYLIWIDTEHPDTVTDADHAAAVEFLVAVHLFCNALSAKKRKSPESVDGFIKALLSKWDGFIIAVAAASIYDDLPQEIARRKAQGDAGKKGAETRKKASKLPPTEVLWKARESLIANGTAPRDTTSKLAKRYDVTPRAIRDRFKRREVN